MLFSDTVKAGFLIVVIAGVINSIISVGYYFKLILAMYTKEADAEKQAIPLAYYLVAVIAIALNVAIGIYPSLLTNLLQ